jgi:DNA-directed RNA polymerase specialized sigma24 family protein
MSVHSISGAPSGRSGGVTAGSAETFEDFFAAINPRLFTALWLVTGDRYEAEEIAQDAFLRVLERWDRVGRLDNPEGYLFRTAMNVFRNRYRRAALALRRSISLSPQAIDELAAVEDRDEVMRSATVRALTSRARTRMKDEAVDPR